MIRHRPAGDGAKGSPRRGASAVAGETGGAARGGAWGERGKRKREAKEAGGSGVAPGGGRGGDGFGEIEFDAEAAAFGLANEAVAEGFFGGEKEGPDISFRGGDQFGGEGVGREILLAGRAGGGGVTAVLGDLVGGAVFVAVVVFEAEAGGGARDHPGARAVVANVEGDLDFVFAAGTHVHNETFAGEGGVGGAGAFGNFAGEGLAAEGAKFGPECFLSGRERAGGEREEEG